MLSTYSFDLAPTGSNHAELRRKVRRFLSTEVDAGRIDPARSTWTTFDAKFTKRCAAAGFVAMTWPKRYNGHEASSLERHVVCEELIAGGAPLGAHWIADRQSGPQIIAHGNDVLRAEILPRIAAGECYIGIGMSEPNSGSDLASVKTKAVAAEGGYRINGRKIWTTNGDRCHYIIALVRTSPASEASRHVGLTQFVIDLKSPGIEIRPIQDLTGRNDFSEITFDDVFVPETHLLGKEGDGWKLVTGELAFERSGPDRFLSNARLLMSAVERMNHVDAGDLRSLGELVCQLSALRTMSLSVAAQLAQGKLPNAEAALVKDVGTIFEQRVPETIRRIFPPSPSDGMGEDLSFRELLETNVMAVTSHTLRGGTTEVLRGIIARELGLR